MVLPVIIGVVAVVGVIVAYLAARGSSKSGSNGVMGGGRGGTGYIPQVCVPNDPTTATAGNTMGWTVTGKASTLQDTLYVDCTPAGDFGTPPGPITIPPGDGTAAHNPISIQIPVSLTATGTLSVEVHTGSGTVTGTTPVVPIPVSVNPTNDTATAGSDVEWNAVLDRPALPGGQILVVTALTPGQFASVPASIIVGSGFSNATFMTILANTAAGTASIQVACNGASVQGDVHVN